MEALGDKVVPTEQYSSVSTELDKLEAQFDRLLDRQEKMQALGVSEESASWKSLQYDIERCSDKLHELRAEKEQLESSGKAFQMGSETSEYQRMAADLEAAKARLDEMKQKLEESDGAASRLSGNSKTVAKYIGSAAKSASGKLVYGIKQAASDMWKMVTHGKKMNGQFSGLISGAKKFALSLLGARGVYALLRKAVNAYMEQNQQLSSTLSSCWTGIGNILGPIITNLINLVATAVSYVTAFLKLFGIYGKTASKEISSAGSAASGAAEDLKKQLASFDELNILSESGSGGGGGGGGAADVTTGLEAVELPDWAKLMAEQIKKGDWTGAGATLATAMNDMLDGVPWDAWGTRFGTYVQNGISFALGFIRTFDWKGLGADLATFLNNAIAAVDPKDLGALLASKLRIVIELAFGFVTTFDWPAFGTWLAGVINGWFEEIPWDTMGQTLGKLILGLLDTAIAFLRKTDWKGIGEKIGTFFKNIPWGDIWDGLKTAAGEAITAVGEFLDGLYPGLDKLLPLIEAIGIAFAAWKIGSGISGGLSKVFGLFGGKGSSKKSGGFSFSVPNVSTVLKGLADVALIILGAIAIVEAIGKLSSTPGFDEAMSTGLEAIKTAFKGIGEVALQITGVSVGIAALGKLGVKQIAQGFADLAIILDGVPVVITALGALMSIPGFDEFLGTGVSSIKTAFSFIGDVALELGVLSAIIVGLGFASPGTIASGLAGLAIVIGGLEAILVALGALNQIPGFSWIVGEGGAVLMQLGEILGGFAGSIVSGLLTTVSDSFPTVADNLSLFATKLEPFLTAMEKVDGGVAAAAENLASAILSFSKASLIEAVTSWVTGGKSLVDFGDQLAAFGPKFAEFADSVADVDAGVVEASANAAQAMVNLSKELPGTGGVLQWITGEKNIAEFGAQLVSFGKAFASYADTVSGIGEDGFAAVKASANAAETMVALAQDIPSQGGVLQWLLGSKDMGTFGESLKTFGECFADYADEVKDIDAGVVDASVAAASSLVALAQDIPTTGGLMSLLFGDSGMGTFGENLKSFGESFAAYYTSISGITISTVTSATSAISGLIDVASAAAGVDNKKLKSFGEALEDFGESLSGTDWASVSSAFVSGMTDMLTSLQDSVSGMKSSMEGLESELTTTWGSIVSNASTKWNDVKTKISTTNDSIKSDTTRKWNAIKTTLDTCVGNIRTSVQSKFNLIRTDIQTVWKNVNTDASEKWGTIKTTIIGKADEIQKKISDSFSQAKTNAINRTSEMVSSVASSWSNLSSKAYSWGSDVASSLASGINDNKWRVSSAASSTASTIKSYLHFSEPDVGPLSDFHTYMPDMMELMAKGIEDNRPAVIKSVSGVATAISEEFNAGEYSIKPLVSETRIDGALGNFSDKIADSFSALVERLETIADRVTFRAPAFAGQAVPYRASVPAGSDNGVGTAIEQSNDELISAVNQVVLSAVATLVAAIERSGVTVNIDKSSLTDMMIEEINKRTRAAGKSPLIAN